MRHLSSRETQVAIMALAINSLSDALWKASTMTDENLALQCLKAGSDSARAILKDHDPSS